MYVPDVPLSATFNLLYHQSQPTHKVSIGWDTHSLMKR